ncbi:ABC transporter transmembrane domain-containing protein [Streptomyces marincola]|uniref:ABC transporter transmembrane domain-containing protein n=1 Tax=Streptomyces marincola TaxID=2878388 RepID=UPI001CF1F581|nr:ABC transporter ATP-binding protein [Streptomyces marincola]UCM87644.1 ABC transporter ATP-binding protein/permease [Streptomyces marincola]
MPTHLLDPTLRATARQGAGRMAVLFALSLAAAGVALALPTALGRALDALLAEGDAAGGPALLTAGLVIAQVLVGVLTTVLTAGADAHGAAWLRGRLLRHLLAAGPGAAARFPEGDLVARATGNAVHAGAAPAALAAAFAAAATPLGAIVALAVTDARLALVFLAGLPLLALLLRAFARSAGDAFAGYQRAQADIAGRLVDALRGARTIAAAGTEEAERRRVLDPLPRLGEHGLRMWRVNARATGRAAALTPLLQLAVVATGGLLLAVGDLTVGGLLAAARYAALAGGVGLFVGHLNRLVRARAAAVRVGEVLAVPPQRHGGAALPPGGPGRVEFRGVSARRGGREVLRGLDLVVPGGSTVALVGRSGAGKSLLAALAGGLAEPDAGRVLIDGVPVTDLAPDALRAEVGYAFERPALLGGTLAPTVAATIGLGPGPAPPPERVAAAARAARADGFIRTLPAGYATRCDGVPLSGGELQRLGLARAFARGGRLLILDDATSSLDTVTELHVARALAAHTAARTRLVVAHRAGSAARADLVAWLDEGRVRALAPHGELWARADYRALWAADEPARGEAAGTSEARAGGAAGA